MWMTFSGYDLMWPILSFVFSLTHIAVQCGSQHTFLYKDPQKDGCVELSGKNVSSYQGVLDCYQSFPFDEKIREKTIDTIIKTLPFYAFIDISRDSPESRIPSRIDIASEVEGLRSKPYKTEMDFQVELVSLFRSLHDGHTGYRSKCFSTFVFRQPFPIITVNDIEAGRGQKFLILKKYEQPSPYLEAEWEKEGIEVRRYLGAEVLLIDAVSPVAFMEHYADEYVGSSRDANSRFNLALARVIQREGKWGIAPGSFAATTVIPEKPYITYTLRLKGGDVETITVPYLATSGVKFKDGKDFYAKQCAWKPVKKSLAPSKKKRVRVLEVPEIVTEKPSSPLPKTTQSFSGDPLSKPLTKGINTQTWMVNSNTGAMTITSFSSDNQDQFLGEVRNGFDALHKHGASNLILDLSNNGGGVICWGYYVLDYLFPSAFQRRFSTDMHETPLLLKLADKDKRSEGFFNFRYWIKENGTRFDSISEFVEDHRYLRGGKVSHYTSRFDDQCGENPLQKKDFQNPPWDIDHLVVVTNSICYSTCSLLVNSLQEIHNITTYALGGIRDRPATACSIQGGTVYDLEYFLEDLKELGLTNHPDSPKHLPTSATFSFTIREAYSTRKFNRLEQEIGELRRESYQKHHKHHHHHHKHHHGHKNKTHCDPPGSNLPNGKGIRPLEFTWNEASFHPAYPGPVTFLSPFQQWRQIADAAFPGN